MQYGIHHSEMDMSALGQRR